MKGEKEINIVIAALLVVIIGLLIHINHKIPPRDYIKEAVDRDRKHTDTE